MAIRTVQVLAMEEVPAGSAGSLACTKSELRIVCRLPRMQSW